MLYFFTVTISTCINQPIYVILNESLCQRYRIFKYSQHTVSVLMRGTKKTSRPEASRKTSDTRITVTISYCMRKSLVSVRS